MRPKLSGTGTAAADFHIAGPAEHGCPGVVQLFGIESPGLTSSLAIGEEVRRRVVAAGAVSPSRAARCKPHREPIERSKSNAACDGAGTIA